MHLRLWDLFIDVRTLALNCPVFQGGTVQTDHSDLSRNENEGVFTFLSQIKSPKKRVW